MKALVAYITWIIFSLMPVIAAGQEESHDMSQLFGTSQYIPPNTFYESIKSRIKEFVPEGYSEWSLEQRERWLLEKSKSLAQKEPNESNTQKFDRYVIDRLLFEEYYFANKRAAAQSHCREKKPLENDIFWRLNCVDIFVGTKPYEESLEELTSILEDAERIKDIEGVILALNDRGWIESSNGMVTEALLSYQKILDIAPREFSGFVYDAMMNTATTYIIHGDKEYIQKGIEMLLNIASENLDIFIEIPDDEKVSTLDTIGLSYFNIGIAYTLHLHEYEKAPKYFYKTLSIGRQNVVDSHIFLALALAKEGNFDEAKSNLAESNVESEPNDVTRAYLTCYRQLAIRHWDSAAAITPCYQLSPHTSIEVTRDIYGRLVASPDPEIEKKGLELFYSLYTTKIEPELRKRAARSATRNEMSRLQLESDLKTKLIEKETNLKIAQRKQKEFQLAIFLSIIVIIVLALWLVLSNLKKKDQLAKKLRELSLHDELTQLGNRRYLSEYIGREIAVVQREMNKESPVYLGVLVLDVDHFKRINDDFGHKVGDQVLVEFSNRLKQACRDSDILVRWGGEEFVLISRVKCDDELKTIAQRISSEISETVFTITGQANIPVTCTIGALSSQFLLSIVDSNKEPYADWESAIAIADLALYWGKENRRNSWNIIFNINIKNTMEVKRLVSNGLKPSLRENSVKIETFHN